jgi:DNA processing protein
MSGQELLYQISITLIKNIGAVNGKKLVAYCGGPEAVFKEKISALEKIPGIGRARAATIKNQKVLQRAEQEIKFIEKYNIRPLFYTEPGYPSRLLNCDDGPLMLYYKGNANLDNSKVIAVVGTRRATNYGKARCEEILKDLEPLNVLVVSGLAYGIDSCAHRHSVDMGLETVGVLGHGLDRIYPAQNKKLAERMLQQGGLLTEFMSGTNPDRENFPRRNRIVAGMADAVLVVESDRKGGALITAEIANSYNRDVFTVPGRVGDDMSRGCHFMIKTNRAALVENGADVAYMMGWEKVEVSKRAQKKLFVELSGEEKLILETIREYGELPIDKITLLTKLSTSKVAASLLNLEFEGLVKSLPGKLYSV